MCCLLTFRGPDDLAAVRQRFRHPPAPSVVISAGPDPELFDVKHRLFDIPYATIFSTKLVSADQLLWGGVFAFDLLRRPSKWSGLQEASRVIADLFRPDGDGYASSGCQWVVDLAQALVDPAAKILARQMDGFLANPSHQPPGISFNDTLARFRQMDDHPAVATQLPGFASLPLYEFLLRPPAEFRVYSIFTTQNDRNDYRGNLVQRFRIVSRPDAGHRLLFQTLPHTIGLKTPTDDELANWFPHYLHSQLRKSRPAGIEDEVIDRWTNHIFMELTGQTRSDQFFNVLAESPPDEREFIVLLGRSEASGLGTPSIVTRYAEITDLSARNEVVSFKTGICDARRECIPLTVLFSCRTMQEARVLMTELAARTLTRLGRDDRIRRISVYYGNPVNQAIHSGYRSADVPQLQEDFIRQGGRPPLYVDENRPLISIHAYGG